MEIVLCHLTAIASPWSRAKFEASCLFSRFHPTTRNNTLMFKWTSSIPSSPSPSDLPRTGYFPCRAVLPWWSEHRCRCPASSCPWPPSGASWEAWLVEVHVEKPYQWSPVLNINLPQQPRSRHCGRNLWELHCGWSSSCWTVKWWLLDQLRTAWLSP